MNMRAATGQKVKKSREDIIFDAINYTFLTLFTLLCVFPFYYVLINSISAHDMVDMGKVMFYPIGIHFTNYVEVLQMERLAMAAWVSLARTVLGTLLALVGASYMAYLFTKQNMWKRKLWYRLVIATMYFSAGLIPGYMNMRMLGLVNTFWVYVIPGIFPVYNMILIKTYMESLSPALEESAAIDGAGYMVRFTRIVLPLCIPILATVALFSAVGHWNSFMDTLLYVTDYRLNTLQYLLYQYINEARNLAAQIASGNIGVSEIDPSKVVSPTSVQLTVTIVVVFPILCVYPFLQRYYVKGIMIGAVKG